MQRSGRRRLSFRSPTKSPISAQLSGRFYAGSEVSKPWFRVTGKDCTRVSRTPRMPQLVCNSNSSPKYEIRLRMDCVPFRAATVTRIVIRGLARSSESSICLRFAIRSPKIPQGPCLSKDARSADFLERKWRPLKKRWHLPDEGKVFYVRKELDREVLPAKVVAKHAGHGQAYCEHAERRLGNNDGKLPFRK